MSDNIVTRMAVNYHRSIMASQGAKSIEVLSNLIPEISAQLVRVWFLTPSGSWFDEMHVDDPETVAGTISMTFERRGLRYAVREGADCWELFGPGKRRRIYQTREAAEMVALHNG